MIEFCHRCGGELPRSSGSSPGDSSFCPHCGAPQLYFPSADESDPAAIDTTGALPPPRPQLIEWKTAIRCALLMGFMAALLGVLSTGLPILSRLNWLWIISASTVALTLYQKRRPLARMDVQVGARIGLVVGLVLISSLALSMAVAGVVARYGLHNMAAFDAQMAQMTRQIQEQLEHTAAANHLPKDQIAYVYSPEFSVWIMLLGFTMLGGIVLVLSALGGAIGGLLKTRQSQP
jgi:hypothetical protein